MATTFEARILVRLNEHLQAFADAEGLELAFENTEFDREFDAYPYLIQSHAPVSRAAITVDRTAPLQGVYQITIVDERDAGSIRSADIAGKLSAHFDQGTRLQIDEFYTRIDSQPFKAPPIPDGHEVRLPITFTYTTIIRRP